MPWSGAGTYSPPAASFPEVNGTLIDAGRYNPTITDLAAGITAALAKNGENSPTANLPMAGFRHSGAGDASVAGQYLVFGQATAGSLTTLGLSLGAVGAPSLFFTGDTNTGVWSPGVDTLAISTQGVERFRVAAGGNVTISDAGTGLSFSNAASGNFNLGLLAGVGSADVYVYQRANAPMLFGTNNTERMRLDANGLLGIGVLPVTQLDVNTFYSFGSTRNGSIRIRDGSAGAVTGFVDHIGSLAVFDGGPYYGSGQRTAQGTEWSGVTFGSGTIQFFTNSGLTPGTNISPTERMRLDATGLLGVGVVPTAGKGAIQIVASSADGIFLGNTDNTNTTVLDYYDEGSGFTPTLTFGGGSTGMTFNVQSGKYQRVGNKVTFRLRILLTAKGSSTGTAFVGIGGIPFTPEVTPLPASLYCFSMTGLTGSVKAQLLGSTSIALIQSGATGDATNLTDAAFTNTSDIQISGFFFV